jgi:non-ribosomal peptide synthetase component F
MDRLAALPSPPRWAGRSRGAAEAGPLGRHAFHLGDAIAGGLDREARARGTTVFSILLAAFVDALRTVTTFDELVVTVGAAGRTHHSVADVFGLVSNNLHLRLATAAIPDFAERAASVDRAVRDALENQEYPSAALEAALRAAGEDTAALGRVEFGQIYPDTLAAHGLEEMMFQLGDTRLSFGGIEVEPLDLPGERLRPEIRLRYQMLAAGLYCRLEYDTELVGESEAASVIESFRARVESFAPAHRPSPTPAPSPPAHEYADDGR